MTAFYTLLFKVYFGLFRPNLIGEEFMWKYLCKFVNHHLCALVKKIFLRIGEKDISAHW